MSKIVELVTAWAEFDQQYPDQSVEQFCQYQLAQQKATAVESSHDRQQQLGGLLKIVGRITSAYAFYHRAAMAKSGLPTAESFYYLNGLRFLGEVRKTELINYLFAEYTTGMEAISRLLEGSYIVERADPADKRAKLIKLTEEGNQALTKAYEYASKAAEMVFSEVQADTIELAQTLLRPIEQRNTQLLSSLKTKEFDTMYNQVIGHHAGGL
jgi:DNA-binding MarR family transcriptional regulator